MNKEDYLTGGYGPSFLLHSSASPATVQFTPVISVSGNYAVYTYIPRVHHASSRTGIAIFDGKTTVEKDLDLGGVRVSGQTSGEWISLGTIHFAKDSNPYIRISNASDDGAVVADAVLFVPIK